MARTASAARRTLPYGTPLCPLWFISLGAKAACPANRPPFALLVPPFPPSQAVAWQWVAVEWQLGSGKSGEQPFPLCSRCLSRARSLRRTTPAPARLTDWERRRHSPPPPLPFSSPPPPSPSSSSSSSYRFTLSPPLLSSPSSLSLSLSSLPLSPNSNSQPLPSFLPHQLSPLPNPELVLLLPPRPSLLVSRPSPPSASTTRSLFTRPPFIRLWRSSTRFSSPSIVLSLPTVARFVSLSEGKGTLAFRRLLSCLLDPHPRASLALSTRPPALTIPSSERDVPSSIVVRALSS